MQDLPHSYSVAVVGTPSDHLVAKGDQLPPITVAPPVQFGGPGGVWTPEELLMAAVANCLVLSFRAIAKASNLEWLNIDCESEGTLDKVERKVMFTKVVTRVKLVIPESADKDKAARLLQRAEDTCFVSNSLNSESHLEIDIHFAA